jgi:hypothetical protein
MLDVKMLQPTKYLNLRTCLLNVASIMISELGEQRVLRLSELDEKIRADAGESANFNFLPALNFLFLTGVLDYDVASDSVYLLTKTNMELDVK